MGLANHVHKERPALTNVAVPAAAGLAVLLWGLTPLGTKLAVHAMDPILVAVLRPIIAAVAALPIAVAWRLPRPAPGRPLRLVATAALSGYLLFPVLFTLGVERTTASHAALIIACAPLATGLIAAALERRWPTLRWWLGCAAAAVGTAWLLSERHGGAAGESRLLGDLLVLASCFAAASGYVAGARASESISSMAVTSWGLGLAGLAALPIALWRGADGFAGADAQAWIAVVYLALGSTFLAFVAWYWALRSGGIGRIGSLQFTQPVIGVVAAVLFLGEDLTLPLVGAAVIVLGGVWLAVAAPGAGPRRRGAGSQAD